MAMRAYEMCGTEIKERWPRLDVLIRSVVIVLLLGSTPAIAQKRLNDLYEPQVFNGMPVRVMEPDGFDADKQYPVIVSLHGAGGRGTDNRKQIKDWNRQLAEPQRRKSFPCYVVAPQTPELWDADDLKNVKALIRTLPSVDMNRIYVMGHSMGGHGTFIFLQLDPDYFAAAAPSAGTGLRRTKDFIDPAKIKDVPIWAFHGDRDGVCPFEKAQKVFSEMKRLSGNMKLTIWKGDSHGVSGKMIVGADNGTTQRSSERCDPEPDFMKWLFSQSKVARNKQPNAIRTTTWKKHVVVPRVSSMINSAVAEDFDDDDFRTDSKSLYQIGFTVHNSADNRFYPTPASASSGIGNAEAANEATESSLAAATEQGGAQCGLVDWLSGGQFCMQWSVRFGP